MNFKMRKERNKKQSILTFYQQVMCLVEYGQLLFVVK